MDRRTVAFSVGGLALSLATLAHQVSNPEVLTTVTELQLREVLATTKFGDVNSTIREEKDEEGLTAFHVYEGQTLRFSLYQYRDSAEGPVTNLGATSGHRASKTIDLRKINTWNANKRFCKAFLDEEGDPMLATDLQVSPGTTKAAIQEWVKTFAGSAREYVDFLKKG